MPASKPGSDKPTGRVVALIVLLVVAAAAVRGYLPAQHRVARTEPQPGDGRVAMVFVVVALSATVTLMAIAIIARLRDPRAVAPKQADLSRMLGSQSGRPSWRVLLIGLAVIVGWLLIMMLVVRLWSPHAIIAPSAPTADPSAAPKAPASLPRPRSAGNNTSMLGFMLAATIPLMLLIVAATVIMSGRRRGAVPGIRTWGGDAEGEAFGDESGTAPKPSESLARAAERGLAEIADRSREPREAIIACYAAMERELANVPGAVPQEFDTASEVLARAVDRHALHAENAAQLVNLFAEARFSPHVMNEGHRDAAVRALRLVLDELGAWSPV
jgi:hypothetical protein